MDFLEPDIRATLAEILENKPWSPADAEAPQQGTCFDCRLQKEGHCTRHGMEIHPTWPACDSFSPNIEN
jgi:hypothetical protein